MLKTKRYKFIGVALLALTLLMVGCGGKEEREAAYLLRAQEFVDEGNFEKAKIEVKNVRQINPNNIKAIYLSGLIAEEELNFRAAFQSFNAVVQLDPNHVKALNKLAYYLISGKQFDQATVNLEKALEIEPDNAESLALMAVMLGQQEGKKDEGADYARRALALDPANVRATIALTTILAEEDPNAALAVTNDGIAQQPTDPSLKELKIQLLLFMKQPDEVPAIYQQLIEQNPEELNYIYRLATFYIANDEQGREAGTTKAENMLRSEIAKNPDEDQLKLWLVKLLGETESLDVGIKELELFVESSPDSEVLRDNLASGYVANDELERAEALYLDVIENDPTSASAISARVKLIAMALKQNDQDKANSLITEVLEIDPENSGALIARARINIAAGGYSAVIPDMRVVLKNQPDSEPALLLLAMSNERLGSKDLALDGYQTLLGYKPDHVMGLVGAGRILIGKQEYDAAQNLLERALKVNPAHPESARLLVTIYSREQEWDKALSVAAQLIEQEKTIALGYYLQGRVYFAKKDYKATIKSMEQSLAANDRIVESLSVLINSYLATDQRDVAIQYLLKHIEKNPDHVNAKELLAGVYAGEKEYDKSLSILQPIIEENPGSVSSYKMLIKIYAIRGETESIDKLLQTAINNSPDTLDFYSLQAQFYQETGKIDKAIASYETFLAKSPDNLIAKNNLASLLLDFRLTDANLQRAAELSNELGATEVPAFLDTAGWVQFQLGNYPQALALLQLAVDNGGNTGVYQYHLGMAYHKNNMPSQAKEALTLAVSVEGQYPGKDEAQKVLDTL